MKLIKININQNGNQTVSARELWKGLGQPYGEFRKWFEQMTGYGFSREQDFTEVWTKISTPGGNQNQKDYELNLDMAKELCMLARSEKGKQFRQYFIEVEKAWNSPEQVLARAMQISNVKMLEYQHKVIELGNKLEMLTHSNKLYTTTEIAKELGYRSATALNNELETRKVQYKVNRTWVLTARYAEKGYVSIKQNVLENGKVVYDRKWTELGRQFLLDLLQELQKGA